MKKLVSILSILVVCSIFATACIVINPPASAPAATKASAAQNQPAATQPPAQVPVNNPPAATATVLPAPTLGAPATAPPVMLLAVNDIHAAYNTSYINVNIHCPEIVGMRDVMMQNGINSGVHDYLNTRAAWLENASIDDETNHGPHPPYSFETQFSVMRNDGAVLSILIEITTYEGGAHPGTETATVIAYNTDPGTQWLLNDLFIPGTNYVADINAEINAIIASDPATSGDYWFTSIDQYHDFYLTDTHLVILFDAYTIAPGAMGAPRFSIPLGNLTNLNNF